LSPCHEAGCDDLFDFSYLYHDLYLYVDLAALMHGCTYVCLCLCVNIDIFVRDWVTGLDSCIILDMYVCFVSYVCSSQFLLPGWILVFWLSLLVKVVIFIHFTLF
jgi:hypothetical protein